MPLTTMTWKRLPTQTPATGLISDVLDAVYNALNSATYYDGSARTQGAGSAGTVSRFQALGLTEAVYVTPTVSALNGRFILAGKAAAGAGTMASPDTSAASVLMCSVNKNSGAFNAWDNAAPFTSGQFFGYWRVVACAAVTVAKVNVYECAEAVGVFFETNTGAVYGCFLGAILDPFTSSEQDAETDGRVYGVITSGTVAAIGTSFWTTAGFLSYVGTANFYHAGIFTPGAGTLVPLDLQTSVASTMNTSRLLTQSGAMLAVPALLEDDGGTGRTRGRLREITMIRDGKLRDLVKTGGVDAIHGVSGSPSADQDSVGLLA